MTYFPDLPNYSFSWSKPLKTFISTYDLNIASCLSVLQIGKTFFEEFTSQQKHISPKLDQSDFQIINSPQKIRYYGNKLSNEDMSNLQRKVKEIARKCNVPEILINHLIIAIDNFDNSNGFSSLKRSKIIFIPERAALQLLEKTPFESSDNHLSLNELKAAIAHELGHLVYQRSFSYKKIFKNLYLKSIPVICSFITPILPILLNNFKNQNETQTLSYYATDLFLKIASSYAINHFFSLFVKLSISEDKTEEIFADHYGDHIPEFREGRKSYFRRLAKQEKEHATKTSETNFLSKLIFRLKKIIILNQDPHPSNLVRSTY